MLQARPEQPGDTPSTEAGAALQQPGSDLQTTGTNTDATAVPQTTPAISQQQLQAAGLRVGDTQTLIANSTSAQSAGPTTGLVAGLPWLILLVLVLLAGAWWLGKRIPRGHTVAQAAGASTVSGLTTEPQEAPDDTAGTDEKPATSRPAKHASNKRAKGSHRKQKRKR